MPIVCGFDFSPHAIEAAEVAAAVARATDDRVVLVHVHDELGAEEDPRAHAELQRKLEVEASALARSGATVEPRTIAGVANDVLARIAEEADAWAVFVGARGHDHTAARRLGGGVVRALAIEARRPVVAVRVRAPFVEWAERARPLKILVALALDGHDAAPLRFTAALASVGACELSILHVAAPDVADQERRCDALAARVRDAFPDDGGPTIAQIAIVRDARPACEVVAEHAARADAGLVVVGRGRRGRLARLLHGSQAGRVIREATTNVAYAPA